MKTAFIIAAIWAFIGASFGASFATSQLKAKGQTQGCQLTAS